jgi:hypothetical protein
VSAIQVINEIKRLPVEEQREVFVFLTQTLTSAPETTGRPWLGRKLSFEEACNVVFRENRELLSLLAK